MTCMHVLYLRSIVHFVKVTQLTEVVEAQNTKLEQVQLECQQAKQDYEAMKEVQCTFVQDYYYCDLIHRL